MTGSHSDALVFFGATGDLAYKKIFPALQAMAKRGNLDIPIVGVAKAGWNLDQLRARARESVEKHGGLDREAFDRLSRQLRYVDGDYHDAATFQALRKELGSAARPANFVKAGSSTSEIAVRSSSQEAITLPRRQTSEMSRRLRSY